ncbi:energy transducer TonB [Sandaracinobacteroides hominis]|uniref:energy transducer TonB n=1 Tax=Sandaracinobacteroides hominis TaxID=2780086 RepID=UPI0018F47E81|nr:energy transducer TonB [Sandaracinobacteroides hominis]
MSYLQEEGWSRRTWISVILVGILHVLLGYALISGLAIKAVKVITGPLEAVNIEEQAPPPEEAPPPPPKLEDIPPYVPPPDVQIETSAPPPPTISVQSAVPQPQPTVAPPAPPAPPPAPVVAAPTPAQPIARTFAVSPEDYPDASRRAGEEGVTGIRVTIGADGRVSACSVVRPSGFTRLDEKACQIAQRRWRFKPATQEGKPVETTVNRNYRWQLEEGR